MEVPPLLSRRAGIRLVERCLAHKPARWDSPRSDSRSRRLSATSVGRPGTEPLLAGDAVWISIDPPGLHDAWRPPVDAASWGGFVLGRDGVPLAAVDPLGASVEWRGGDASIGG